MTKISFRASKSIIRRSNDVKEIKYKSGSSLFKTNIIKSNKITNNRFAPVQINRTTNKKIGKNSLPVIQHARNSHNRVVDKVNKNNAVIRNKNIINDPRRMRDRIVNYRNSTLHKYADYIPKINALKNSGRGKILIIVAVGPSILEAKLEKFKNNDNIDIMAINKPDDRIWPCKYWCFCDQSQYNRNKEKFNSYMGTLINTGNVLARKDNQILVKTLNGKGFSRNLTNGYHVGRSSTYAAMQAAYWMDYDKIYIFGCDMGEVELEVNGSKRKMVHSYGVNPDVTREARLDRFKFEADHYDHAASKILSKSEISKFAFCTTYNKWPFIEKFENMDHRTAHKMILKYVEDHYERNK